MSRVQSIERAFSVLGALADGPVGVSEVAERVALPKSTTARLLSSLVREGVVEQVPGGTRYRLGGRIAALAAGLNSTAGLVAVARPHLVELASATGEAAGLSVPDGALVHYIDQVDTTHQVQVRDWTGTRVPMHAVSSGQVFLAHAAPSALERLLAAPLERFTDETLTLGGALPIACARCCSTAVRGCTRSSPRDSIPLPRRSSARTARSSPRSMCTARRIASPPRGPRRRSPRR